MFLYRSEDMSSERNRKIIIQLGAGLVISIVLLFLFRLIAFLIADVLVFLGYGLIGFFAYKYFQKVIKGAG